MNIWQCCMQFFICIYIYTSASGLLGEEALLRDWQRPKYKWGLDVDNFLFPSDHGKFTLEKKEELLSRSHSLWPLHDIFLPVATEKLWSFPIVNALRCHCFSCYRFLNYSVKLRLLFHCRLLNKQMLIQVMVVSLHDYFSRYLIASYSIN